MSATLKFSSKSYQDVLLNKNAKCRRWARGNFAYNEPCKVLVTSCIVCQKLTWLACCLVVHYWKRWDIHLPHMYYLIRSLASNFNVFISSKYIFTDLVFTTKKICNIILSPVVIYMKHFIYCKDHGKEHHKYLTQKICILSFVLYIPSQVLVCFACLELAVDSLSHGHLHVWSWQ